MASLDNGGDKLDRRCKDFEEQGKAMIDGVKEGGKV